VHPDRRADGDRHSLSDAYVDADSDALTYRHPVADGDADRHTNRDACPLARYLCRSERAAHAHL
jgi:hypothetical protein